MTTGPGRDPFRALLYQKTSERPLRAVCIKREAAI